MQWAIFSDVDGTLYDRKRTISPEVIAAITKAQASGVEFVLATGNGPFSNMRSLAKLLKVRYLISSNGALILDLKVDKPIFMATIPMADAQRLVDIGLKHQVSAAWWDMEEIYVSNNDKRLGEIAVYFMANTGTVNYTSKVKRPCLKLQFLGASEQVAKVLKEMASHFTNLQIAPMSDTEIEITQPDVSKGQAIEHFAKHFDLPLDHCMAVGDSSNDRTMLELLDHSYAMGNSPDVIKRAAKRVTHSVGDHGAASAIHDFLRIKEKTK